MKLVQTIQMMKSEDYHERFLAEYFQLKIRHDRLVETVEKYKAGTLEFTPNCPMEVYKLQLEAMEKYLDVLVIRAKIEGIELVEPKKKKTNNPKFNLDDYSGDCVMHCTNREEAKIFCKYLHNHGHKWRCGESYAEINYWNNHKDKTCYAFNEDAYGEVEDHERWGYKVLEFSDFDWSEEPKTKPKFSFANYPEDYAMHCHSNEQCQMFYNVLKERFGEKNVSKVGVSGPYFRWGLGDNFFSGICGSSIVDYKKHGFTTLDFDDFDWSTPANCKPKFNIDDYLGDVVMHCSEENKAITFCKYLDSQGKTWSNGDSYLVDTRYNWCGIHDTEMCYNFNDSSYSDIDYYREHDYKILEFDDFDWTNN